MDQFLTLDALLDGCDPLAKHPAADEAERRIYEHDRNAVVWQVGYAEPEVAVSYIRDLYDDDVDPHQMLQADLSCGWSIEGRDDGGEGPYLVVARPGEDDVMIALPGIEAMPVMAGNITRLGMLIG